jgi:hypothetical protein
MRYPGRRLYADGEWVRTPKRQIGQVLGSYLEHEPQHDWSFEDNADEHMQHVYVVEMAAGNKEPWPEDMLEQSSVLDALVP